jgi:EAL and modified HD-GYP domain-containing signal transduction protein
LAVVGRQPIFDRRLQVYGYELLFRLNASSEHADMTEGGRELSSARTFVNSFVEIGLENVVGSALAFVNVTRRFLLSDFIHVLPKDRVVLELLEDVPAEPDVLARLEELACDGYHLALDDYVHRPELAPLIERASIVKLDISQLDAAALKWHVEWLKSRGRTLVAERVETREELDACRALGFDLFQGYFLARPANIARHRAPDGDRLTALHTLALLNSPKATIDEIESAISRDVTLSYRLLRAINSAAYGLSGHIESLRQAIVHLGRETIRSWVGLMLLSGLSNQPVELLTTGLVRARMCERVGELLHPEAAHSYFTAGLFSILDAVLDMPMPELIGSLPLTPELLDVLAFRSGPIGEALNACVAYEQCDWDHAACAGLTTPQLAAAYLDSIRWSRTVMSRISAA